MQSYKVTLILLSALLTLSLAQALGQTKAKIAVIQADGSPRQDPFKSSYDFAKVKPMSQAHLDKLLGLLEEAGRMGADLRVFFFFMFKDIILYFPG